MACGLGIPNTGNVYVCTCLDHLGGWELLLDATMWTCTSVSLSIRCAIKYIGAIWGYTRFYTDYIGNDGEENGNYYRTLRGSGRRGCRHPEQRSIEQLDPETVLQWLIIYAAFAREA